MPEILDQLYESEKNAVEKSQKERDMKTERLYQAYKEMLSSKNGVFLIRHILDKCGFFSSKFTGNAHTYYLEGRSDIGREILTEIAAYNPKAFMKVCLQGLKHQKHLDQRR